MPLELDPGCRAAIDLAKRALPEGTPLDAGTLLAALYHGAKLGAQYPQLERHLAPPAPVRQQAPAKVTLAPELRPLFQELADAGRPVSAADLFAALIASETGRSFLERQGMRDPPQVAQEGQGHSPAGDCGTPASDWRASAERAAAIKALDSFGRMLTVAEPPHTGVVERERTIRALVRILSKMRRRNAILVGPAGCGKSAVIYELARRMHRRDASLPPKLRDMDIFELSPSFLRSGASMVGQYDERVKALIEVLRGHPKIILFVDEIHSLFHSGVHERGPFSDANESFKGALGRGEITCLGATTPAEYRHAIEPDKALERRFETVRLDPPTPAETLAILEARRARMEEYYAPLRIPGAALRRTVELTEEYLPGRFQPDKSIQLLDEACAFCATAEPPLEEVAEQSLMEALQDVVGHGVLRPQTITEEAVFDRLREKIVGQDGVLRPLARAFVAGLGDWSKRSGPRGVYLLGGPTGVGKTETALLLARILGGGHDCLVRVDCNTLPPSIHDSGPVLNRLLGVPPGYVGYARGQGGLLSRIRDLPESVVLFDEFEKAGPAAGRLVLQIIDDGRLEDVDGNVLDFRRAYVVFTTNAGCAEASARVGFAVGARPAVRAVAAEDVKQELRQAGLGDEFFGRLTHVFMFQALKPEDIRVVLARQLEALREASRARGLELRWSDELVAHLGAEWQPRFGVRFAVAVLRNRVTEQLDVASAQGEMKDVKEIVLRVLERPEAEDAPYPAGLALRAREGTSMVIRLA